MPSVEQGAIKISTANAMGNILNKKMGVSTGFAPKDWADTLNLCGKAPEKTVSGAIAHIDDGADRVPVKAWGVTLPASLDGYSSVDVVKTGKNLLDDSLKGISGHVIWFGHTSGNRYDKSVFLKKGTYTLSVEPTDGVITNLYINNSDTQTAISGFPAYNTKSKTFTLSEDTNCSVNVYRQEYTSVSDILTAQIEVGDTTTTYEPYSGTVSTVNLGRTIYGGEVDVVQGTGTETYDNTSLDNLNYNYLSNITRFNVAISGADSSGYKDDIVIPTGYTISHTLITNAANAPDMTMCMYNGSLYVKNLSCTSKAELQSALSGKTLTFPLATSTDFTFTPITPTPQTALGINNFLADEGDSQLTYRRDIDLALGE